MHGLLGSHSGQANDFQLPDGTVLAQPLSGDQIHSVYADAWRVAPGASLLDDAHGPALSQLVQAMATGLVSTGTGQPATQWAEDASSYAPIEFIPVASSF